MFASLLLAMELLKAEVRIDSDASRINPAVHKAAHPFPLSAVRLLDSPFKKAQDADEKYLLSLEPDRLLHRFRKFAGLEAKAPQYGGWERDTISGHSLGHYLSACAQMYAATRNSKLKEKVDYVVEELEACQDKAGTGYVAGLPDHERLWGEIEKGEIRSKGFDLNGLWVPWYNLHKTFAGLLDAHELAGSKEALEVAKRLADWCIHVTRNLDEAKWQQMLACEHGGMNESLAELYARTGQGKYLELARKFYHKAILDPLSEGKDILSGKHGNTNIPKVIGCARLYELKGEEKDKKVAEFFWDRVVNHHAYAIGGITSGEYFGPPDQLADRLTGSNCETCKTYNMLKLTWRLFSWKPDSTLADYAERALYNHILASQNPETGMMTYFMPLMPGSKKSFSTPTNTFTCCVGSGMENHAKYGEGIYFHNADTLWVNLYIPSEVEWKEKGLKLGQNGAYPGYRYFDVLSASDSEFTLKLRIPSWLDRDPEIDLNGEIIKVAKGLDGYVTFSRVWKKGDRLTISMAWPLRFEPMPDNPNRVAVFYGPYALAADLGFSGKSWEPGRMPVLVAKGKSAETVLDSFRTGGFVTRNVGKPFEFVLWPLYYIKNEPYSVYFDLFTEEEWKKEEERYRAEEAAKLELEKRTVDYFAIGEMQPERDHELEGQTTYTGDFGGRKYRDARNGGWFEFTMKVDPEAEQEILFTYWGSDTGRTFDILVDGEKLMTQRLQNNAPGKFFEVAQPLSVKGKSSIRVRFQAPANGLAGGLFGCRVARLNQK